MNIWIILAIICVVAVIIGIIIGIKIEWDNLCVQIITIICSVFFILFITMSIHNNVDVKNTEIRYLKEREQIIYQIEHLTENSDKIKLNEWILTYNDWINDINSDKETYGYLSWYNNLDMSKHKIIDLV